MTEPSLEKGGERESNDTSSITGNRTKQNEEALNVSVFLSELRKAVVFQS